jgi:FkbM family methyltransferase
MKKNVKRIIRSLGWELHRLSPATDASYQLKASLDQVGANVVFDIGANVGQFGQEIRSAGYRGKIVSFEPLTQAHVKLISNASLDTAWIVHPRAAVGDRDGSVEINIAGNSVSSSILPMLDSHSSAESSSAYVGQERTPLVMLDTVAGQYLDTESKLFLKIDTQGFEWQVLDGASETLKLSLGVLLEMSFVPLYDHQPLWLELVNRMESSGFTLWAIQRGFTDKATGRSLQCDGIFLRE